MRTIPRTNEGRPQAPFSVSLPNARPVTRLVAHARQAREPRPARYDTSSLCAASIAEMSVRICHGSNHSALDMMTVTYGLSPSMTR